VRIHPDGARGKALEDLRNSTKESEMYRKILVGYDGREPGRDALALAAALRARDGVVTAACVYPVTGHAANERLVADAAQQTLAEARTQADGDWVECSSVPGQSPAHGLHVLSERLDPDLVVVGSSHRAEHGHVHAGSTGERLLNGSRCPVAIAPEGFAAQTGSPRVIGVAYDGSESSETALLEAMALAAEFDATLKLITVVPPLQVHWSGEAFAGGIASGETIREQRRNGFQHVLEEAAERVPAEARAATVLRDGRPATVIADEAEKGIHLLVMGSRNYGPIRRVMAGSTAIELMRLSPCPVLVVPRGASAPSAEAAEAGTATAT
jgi:nucleotide-binding universal stress UspA family protein